METITKAIEKLGTAGVDARLEELLVDGILLRSRSRRPTTTTSCCAGSAPWWWRWGSAQPYLPQICGTIKWRLNNKNAEVRQQARIWLRASRRR